MIGVVAGGATGRMGGPGGQVYIYHVDSVADGNDATTFTLAIDLVGVDPDCPGERADRKIAVGIFGDRETAGVRSVVSCKLHVPTVAADPTGTAMSFVVGEHSAPGNPTEIWLADLPIGTAAEAVVVFNNPMDEAGIGVVAVYAADTTHDTATDIADPCEIMIDVPSGGAVFCMVGTENTGAAFGFTGATEIFDDAIPGAGSGQIAGAVVMLSGEQLSYAITATETPTSTSAVAVAVSFKPLNS